MGEDLRRSPLADDIVGLGCVAVLVGLVWVAGRGCNGCGGEAASAEVAAGASRSAGATQTARPSR